MKEVTICLRKYIPFPWMMGWWPKCTSNRKNGLVNNGFDRSLQRVPFSSPEQPEYAQVWYCIQSTQKLLLQCIASDRGQLPSELLDLDERMTGTETWIPQRKRYSTRNFIYHHTVLWDFPTVDFDREWNSRWVLHSRPNGEITSGNYRMNFRTGNRFYDHYTCNYGFLSFQGWCHTLVAEKPTIVLTQQRSVGTTRCQWVAKRFLAKNVNMWDVWIKRDHIVLIKIYCEQLDEMLQLAFGPNQMVEFEHTLKQPNKFHVQ